MAQHTIAKAPQSIGQQWKSNAHQRNRDGRGKRRTWTPRRRATGAWTRACRMGGGAGPAKDH